ncbi:ABC transporter permease [Paenibacillus dokdonensis]|uniref:ABC transporter permease n=1 Tax=Paenibacillus dokdonensis TaxID=2567944 RepID=UPI0010A7E75A|nr:ABC transporter permease subunit [Paenibacillus dokdonensis]
MMNLQKGKWRKTLREHWPLYMLSLPGLAALLLFSYIPMAGLYIVFERYTYQGGLFGSEFVGLKNFEFFFSNMENALRATRNTIVVNIFSIILTTVVAVSLAVFMNEIRRKWFKKVTQSVMFFPHFISWVVVGTIAITFLDEKKGILNKLLVSVGMDPVLWYSNPWLWWPLLVFFGIWKAAGFNSIIYFASITGFDTSYYEAATVDGATKWQQIAKITIPLLMPTIVILFLLAVGGILAGDITQILGLTNLNPMLLETTDNISTFVYRTALQNGQFESASAVQLYQSIVGFVLVMFSNWIVKRYDKEYALF